MDIGGDEVSVSSLRHVMCPERDIVSYQHRVGHVNSGSRQSVLVGRATDNSTGRSQWRSPAPWQLIDSSEVDSAACWLRSPGPCVFLLHHYHHHLENINHSTDERVLVCISTQHKLNTAQSMVCTEITQIRY